MIGPSAPMLRILSGCQNPAQVAKIVATGENYRRLWFPDPQVVASHLPEWIRQWQREVAH